MGSTGQRQAGRWRVWAALAVTLPAVSACSAGADDDSAGDDDSSRGDQTSPPEATPPVATAPDGSTGDPYDIGTPSLIELYVAPDGSAEAAGTQDAPLSLEGAWARGRSGLASSGYRFLLEPGHYACEGEYCHGFTDLRGTYERPVIFTSIQGRDTVVIGGGLNLYGLSHVYFIELTLRGTGTEFNSSYNNVLHLEQSDHILLRDLIIAGPESTDAEENHFQEVVKANQCRDLYLEESDISGAYQTALDYFAVQGGHLLNNRIHRSGGHCAYVKGGSAYLRVAGNEFYDCRVAGFQAGEGSTFELMVSPWLHYEAYDVKVVNNVFHDVQGAGAAVWGGYNILIAHNTFYKVGLSSGASGYGLLQLSRGGRGCYDLWEVEDDAAACEALIDAGGWGTAEVGMGGEWIPNRNVYLFNNLFYNPAPARTEYFHLGIDGPAARPAGAENSPDPAVTDDGLVIRGNLFWNAPDSPDLPLVASSNGSELSGCAASNPTCNEDQLRAENQINGLEPLLRDPEAGDFRPVAGGAVEQAGALEIPPFSWDDAPSSPAVPMGELDNAVTENRAGEPRGDTSHPGAY